MEAATSRLGLSFIPDGSGDLQNTVGPRDLFNYIYAVLHSTEYRRRYAAFLKSDFARVTLTSDLELFSSLAALGQSMVSLHLMETSTQGEPSYPKQGNSLVERVRYSPPGDGQQGRVYVNKEQYFEGVTPETWNFTKGGYRPAEKWLKDRKGRVLAFEDIAHYRRICAVLSETSQLMVHIDQAINARGGWPLP